MAPKKGIKDSELHTSREGLINSLNRNKAYVTNNCSSMTAAELEARLSLIESTFNQVCSVQTQIEQVAEDASEYGTRQTIEDMYCEVKAKILSCLVNMGRRQSMATGPAAHSSMLSPSQLASPRKLPQLKLPQFSGKFTEWTSWYNTFIMLIDSDVEIDDLSKFIHLKSCLGTIPQGTIEGLELSEANYKRALRLLKERFENKAIIFQSHVSELFNIKRLRQAESEALNSLVDSVNLQLEALKSMGSDAEILGAVLFHLIRGKLDDVTLERWENDFDCTKLPSWELLSKFLNNRSINLASREVRRVNSSWLNKKCDSKKSSLAAAVGTSNDYACYSCSGTHQLKLCPKFKALSALQRYYEVKKLSLCLMCFSKRHSTKDCKVQRCTLCGKPHHELLHREAGENNGAGNKLNSAATGPNSLGSLHSSLLVKQSTSFLATAVVLIRDSEGCFQKCRCVLDSGSQLNFVTADLVSNLNLKIRKTEFSLSGIGNSKSEILGEIETTFKSRVTNFKVLDKFCVLKEITHYNPSIACEGINWQMPRKIKLADPMFNSAQNIDMLLGVNLFFKLIVAGQIRLGPNRPTLQKSLLGWIVVGECASRNNISLLANETKYVPKISDELHELVQRFWQCEEVVQPMATYTRDEQQCEKSFLENVKWTASGRLMVALPFKIPKQSLGESYQIALTRFLSLERKLIRNPDLKEKYVEFIEEYRQLRHLEAIDIENMATVKYFMPHHPVIRPESLTTKLRVVFDASCKSSNNFSLNDTMLVGAKLQPDLFDILLKFRFYRYAITADVAKMYRQILVRDEDCDYQCILWRSSSAEPIQILRLKTVTYGTSSAPYLAVRCLNYLAELYASEFPLGSETVKRSFYMDDMLCGADSVSQLIKLKHEVTCLLKRAKFELHKWRTNCSELVDNSDDLEPFRIRTDGIAKALGIYWASQADEFRFSYKAKFSSSITKRVVLSELSQLFDPLGFLCPILILGKIFMQEIWLLQSSWDEELPSTYILQWEKYREELELIQNLSLPRSVVPVTSDIKKLELCGFSDASIRAFGGAIYARVTDHMGIVSVHLVTAKSRVAPVRVTSLPRLELQGALLMTQLMAKVCSAIHIEINRTIYFTDSTIVLNWLSSHASRWTTFVANRVAQIQELSKIRDWYKIESKLNPADIVSRGLYIKELKISKLWWHGPEFLQKSLEEWPNCSWQDSNDLMPEERKTRFTLITECFVEVEDLVGKCKFANDFLKLQRVFAYIFRWRRMKENTYLRQSIVLTAAEMKGGLSYIVANIQNLRFHEEIFKLQEGRLIKAAKIQGLNPFLDEREGISVIRVGGRLSQADVPFDIKHPILLPGNHIVVNALIDYTHRINLHAGAQALCAFLRQKYWIMNCRKLARKTVRSCITCFRQRPVLANQIMGELPANRVRGSIHPFSRTGLDFAGPLWMHFNIRGRRPVKVYLCVFVCFLTKACHLEIVSDLSASAFIAALKRFFARRGLSTDLFCDNATNFVGASRELKENRKAFDEASKHRIIDACSQRNVTFHFIPPRSPHFGGLWESAVKIAKQHLVKCVNGTALNYEELSTAVAQVEAVMNSRPLYPLSSDPNDYEALTPGHFLVGRPLNALLEPYDDGVIKLSMVNRWKRILLVHNTFWKRWSHEYLTLLQERAKWKTVCNNIEPGTMVLIAEDNTPPGLWPLARVQDTHIGADGIVRVVTVRTKTGCFKRNIHKLCPLPLNNN